MTTTGKLPRSRHTARWLRALLPMLLATFPLTSCRENPMAPQDGGEPTLQNPDWTPATHGSDAAPAYATVFPQNAVNTITITLTAADWAAIRADMRALSGSDFGAGSGAGGGMFTAANPMYVPVTLTFNGRQWLKVGFRLKGNSSLNSAWRQGSYKLPFRLNFDRFEEQYPAFRNQRFHGFKELSLSNGFSDASLLREKVAADVFRMAGVPAAHTAFYRVFIDFGAGARYCGVYTMVEVLEDTGIEQQLGGASGNIYKPESRLQTFVQSQFEKKNNTAAASWSDVQSFIAALNNPMRTTNAAQWRAGLEAVFDVDHYLKLLAVNNAIVNWDTYGQMAHNYYLYNHPTRGLVWFPWDLNMSLSGGAGITGTATPATGPGNNPGGRSGLSLTMNEVAVTWPLLRFIADEPVYFERYRTHMRTFRDEVFSPANVEALLDYYQALIQPYVLGAEGEQPGYTMLSSQGAFVTGNADLRTHMRNRRALLATFLP